MIAYERIKMFHLIISEVNLKKKGRQVEIVKSVFDSADVEYELHATATRDEVRDITAQLTAGKGNSVIVLGGDGTLHDVLNAFADFETPLGIIPLGTGNDFAESARIPADIKKAAQLIVSNPPRPIDYIQFENGLRSLNAFGMGIDVDVLERAYAGKSVKRSKYLRALIVSLAKFKSHNFTVRYNGVEEKHFGLIAAVGNGRQFGGGIKLFPDAKIDDGYLDLFMIDFVSKFKILGAFIKLMRGKINKVKQVRAVRVKEVEFIPDGKNFTFQADGELYSNIPIKAKLIEGKLKFYTV